MLSRRAFTIIELIAVVAVIGVLLAILLPALAGARRAARSAACLVNLRSIGQAVQMYRGDNDGLLPFANAHIDFSLDYRDPLPALEQYLDVPLPTFNDRAEIISGAPFICPDDSQDWPRLGASYFYTPVDLMNYWFTFSFDPLPQSRKLLAQRATTAYLSRDSSVILFAENAPYHASDTAPQFPLAGRNVLLLDGSARRAAPNFSIIPQR